MSVRVLVVEHEEDGPPARFGAWLTDAGAEVEVWRPYAGDQVPTSSAHDALVVLGGSMDAGDDRHAWLEPTRELIRSAAERQVPTLGICLGSQLCGLAFGGVVGRNPLGQQVGLYEIGWTEAAADDALFGELSRGGRGVQWNDDLVLELPDTAVALARTSRGELQAARYAPTVWGVQWHPEVDVDILRVWAEGDAERHLAGGIDQEQMLAEVELAQSDLDATWRPLAEGLVRASRRTPG